MSKVIGQIDEKFKEILADAEQSGNDTAAGANSKQIKIYGVLLSLVLIGLTMACFARCLTGYFLADDFGEVAYVSKICAGRWDMFLANWTGNYMQIPGMAVYRPLLLVSLIGDFLLWKGNAVGYYLTNLLFVSADAVLLFYVCRQLTSSWSPVRSLTASFFAAALFAVNPLHCESITWVVGRVDTGCAFFYLTALLFFLKQRQSGCKALMAAATVAFWCALFFKEMAIGLPIFATAIAFLFPRPAAAVDSARQKFNPAVLSARAINAVIQCAPFWISTAAYFILRYAALGTLLGGYSGAIGDGQANSAIARWLDLSTYWRVLFPFTASIFAPEHSYRSLLLVCVAALSSLILLRCLRKEIPLVYAGLIGAWLITAALPIYKLWGIGLNLEGARFCFFLTMPLSAALPLLAMAQKPQTAAPNSPPDKASIILPALILTGIIAIFYKTSLATNATWVHAGKEVKAVQASAVSTANAWPGSGKLIVLGIPKRNDSAHMIYNGATFKTMLEPPFTNALYSQRFLTFDPIFFGPDVYINSARLKQTVADAGVQAACQWQGPMKGFSQLPLKELYGERNTGAGELALPIAITAASAQPYTDAHATITPLANGARFENVAAGDGLRFANLQINPFAYDFIQFRCRFLKPAAAENNFKVSWTNNKNDTAVQSVAADKAGIWQTIRIPLSHYWRWYTCGKISQLALILPTVKDIEIADVKLLPDKQLRPLLQMKDHSDDGMGVFICPGGKATVSIDATTIPAAGSVEVECSKPNYFFDQFADSKQADAVHKTVTLKTTKTKFDIARDFCPPNQYCEVRIRALAEDGQPLGEYSEPIIVYINK